MKTLSVIMLLAILTGCAKGPKPAVVQPQIQDTVETRLKADLSKAQLTIQGRRIDLVVEWVTHSYARNCQRPLDVNLVDNKMGAFVNPIQNLTPLDGLSLQDVAAVFAKQVETYLKDKKISERQILAGENISLGTYMNWEAEQNAAPLPSEGAPSEGR